MTEKLDCVFCHRRVGVDFHSLAYHVKYSCAAARARRVRLGLPDPGPKPAKGRDEMSSWDTHTPTPSRGNGKGKNAPQKPIMSTDDLGGKERATVIATGKIRDFKSQYGNGFFVEIKHLGKLMDFRVRENTGNDRALKELAPTEKKLAGLRIVLERQTFVNSEDQTISFLAIVTE